MSTALSTSKMSRLSQRCEIIFDLDDTLINSFQVYCEVHRMTARVLGLPILSPQELVAYDQDFPTTLSRQYRSVAGFDVGSFIRAWDELADRYPYLAIDGVSQAIERLLDLGHQLWIVTSRSRTRLLQRMTEGGLKFEWFKGVYPRDDQPHQKPDPRCFEPVWRALGSRPGETELERVLYVGDRYSDQQAAEAAGLRFIGVRSGPEASSGFLNALPATQVIDTAAALPDWLEAYGL